MGDHLELDADDHHALMAAIAHYCRTAPVVPASMWRTRERLDRLIRQPSAIGRQCRCARPQLADVETIGTKLAARILGRSERWVCRHANDLGGVRVGSRSWSFDARVVREYRDHLTRSEGDDADD